jgi:hypothetical protein
VIIAISLRAPPQSGQVRTSTANTRRKSSDQRSSAHQSLRVLAGLESAALESGELEVAGRLEYAALGSVETWCESFDARGAGTILSRHWAAGASTPW